MENNEIDIHEIEDIDIRVGFISIEGGLDYEFVIATVNTMLDDSSSITPFESRMPRIEEIEEILNLPQFQSVDAESSSIINSDENGDSDEGNFWDICILNLQAENPCQAMQLMTMIAPMVDRELIHFNEIGDYVNYNKRMNELWANVEGD